MPYVWTVVIEGWLPLPLRWACSHGRLSACWGTVKGYPARFTVLIVLWDEVSLLCSMWVSWVSETGERVECVPSYLALSSNFLRCRRWFLLFIATCRSDLLKHSLIGSSGIRTHDPTIVGRTRCHLSYRASVTLHYFDANFDFSPKCFASKNTNLYYSNSSVS